MFRLSKMADYGILLLVHVARAEPGRRHTAPELAAAAHLPLPTVSKVVKALVRAGLLCSWRGTQGGCGLSRPAEAISMVDVIAALEGPVALTACAAHAGGRCELTQTCVTRGSWQRLNAVVLGALGEVTLAEMARGFGLPQRRPSRRVASPAASRQTTVHSSAQSDTRSSR